jgi:hypothetical protein
MRHAPPGDAHGPRSNCPGLQECASRPPARSATNWRHCAYPPVRRSCGRLARQGRRVRVWHRDKGRGQADARPASHSQSPRRSGRSLHW